MAGPTPFRLDSAFIADSRSLRLNMALKAFLLSWRTTLGVFIWMRSFSRGRNTPRWGGGLGGGWVFVFSVVLCHCCDDIRVLKS